MSEPIPFVRELAFEYGRVDQVSPLIRRVVARNPGPFTFHGTGTYIVGRGEVAVIDPGPELADHLEALSRALAGERVTHIVVTHTHLDHSPLAAALKTATGAATYGYGRHGGGGGAPGPAVEEGGDADFAPDVTLAGGGAVAGPGWTLEAVHTPGHTSNHLCLALAEERALFSGDHVMGWSTTVVSPPDGDMGAYMASLDTLARREDRVYWPTHGAPIAEPRRFVRALAGHRRAREAEIAGWLGRGVATIPELVERMYAGVPKVLHGAAGHTVLAHLIHLAETGRAAADGPPGLASRYRLL